MMSVSMVACIAMEAIDSHMKGFIQGDVNSRHDLCKHQSTSGIASSGYSPSAGINIPVGVEGEKVPERKLPTEQVPPNKNALEMSKAYGSLETFRAERVSFLLSNASESYSVKEEMVGEVAKVSVGDLNGEAHGTPVEEIIGSPPPAGINVMNIILVAAECTPWSKTGGLGDVAGVLPKALARCGHRVMVVAPYYGNMSNLNTQVSAGGIRWMGRYAATHSS